MVATEKTQEFPPLPFGEWEQTRNTLHLFMQIAGKVRLYTHPKMNHWWHVPLYVSTTGLTTRPIPYRGRHFELAFDFDAHRLNVLVSGGETTSIGLENRSVASFYREVNAALARQGLEVDWKLPVPYDVPFAKEPFASDDGHATYQPDYVSRYWRILLQVDAVFQEFRGRFVGKSSPAHLFWHHMDYAVTRFSGRPAKGREGAGIVEREAYSHEVISLGFWPGDDQVRAPAFYAYAAPAPEGLFEEPLQPEEAKWNPQAGMALLMYDDIREAADPRQKIMDFLESVYTAAARRADWSVDALRLPAG